MPESKSPISSKYLKFANKILIASNKFAILAVFVLVISLILIVFTGVFKLFIIFRDVIFDVNGDLSAVDIQLISAKLLGIVDLYVLGIVMYLFTIAVYQLFIGPVRTHPWLRINCMDDLKSHLAKMMVLFLSTFLVEKVVSWKDPEMILYFGGIVVLTCLMLIWYTSKLSCSKGSNSSHQNIKQ